MKSPKRSLPLKICSSIALLVGLLNLDCGPAQAAPGAVDPRIEFPDIPGYRILKCDFHVHTAFSDGKVWPDIRVDEALHEGLDAIAITDHLEYKPHLKDLEVPDHNRSYLIAQAAAANRDLIVVRGAEITRGMPPGHLNALFLKDVNLLVPDLPATQLRRLMNPAKSPADATAYRDSAFKVLHEAARQGAFVIWNHPAWLRQTPDGVAKLTEMHEQMLKENLFQGIEVANGYQGYSAEALQIALDHNLTLTGSSDIHSPIDQQYINPWQPKQAEGGHRPVTLVFALEKTEAALKEALIGRRTVVWWNNILIGRQQWLGPLLTASLNASVVGYHPTAGYDFGFPETSAVVIEINNITDANFILRNVGPYQMSRHIDVFTVPAHDTVRIEVKTLKRLPEVVLQFEVLNAINAPRIHPVVTFTVATGLGQE